MANIFEGFFDNLISGGLNPKGNFGDYQHAARTYVQNQFRLAPKVKFLYHVHFHINKNVMAALLPSWNARHFLESGLMVKDVSLPAFNVNIETKRKYNRTKHVQTHINYDPVTMSLHDDNLGMMTGLLEAYYRYYYTDAWGENQFISSQYNKLVGTDSNYSHKVEKTSPVYDSATGRTLDTKVTSVASPFEFGDNTYKNEKRNNVPLGLNAGSKSPFFTSIEISQLSRHTFTQFKLINPIVASWNYGDMSQGGTDVNALSVTFNYETVWIERGATKAGKGEAGTSPVGFGDLPHYDVTPSPLNILGGGTVGVGSTINAVGQIINMVGGGDGRPGDNDLFDYKQVQGDFNPLAAIIGGVNILQNASKITEAGVLEEVGGLITGAAGTFYNNRVGGISGFGGPDE